MKDRLPFEKSLRRSLETWRSRGSDEWQRIKGIDEFGAVSRSPGHAIRLAMMLNTAAWPKMYRFGIGIGEIDIQPNAADLREKDGSAFHCAANAIERAESKVNILGIETHRPDPRWDATARLAEASIQAISATMSKWHKRSGPIAVAWLEDTRRGCEPTQTMLAEQFSVDRSVVSRALRRTDSRLILDLEDTASAALDAIFLANDPA